VIKKTMYLRGIAQEVVREAKAMAAREGITLTALVQRALERETQLGRSASGPLSEIAEDMAWYEANLASLLEQFEGEFLAIVEGEVEDHDADVEALAARVAARYGARSVYMPRCQRALRVAEVRSPRIAG